MNNAQATIKAVNRVLAARGGRGSCGKVSGAEAPGAAGRSMIGSVAPVGRIAKGAGFCYDIVTIPTSKNCGAQTLVFRLGLRL